MAVEPLNFWNDQKSGSSSLAGASPVAINVVRDASGAVRRRPGIASFDGAPATSVDPTELSGLYVTTAGAVYAVGAAQSSQRPVYRVSATAAVELAGSIYSGLAGIRRPVFAETEALLVIAGGGAIQKVVLATDYSDRLGGSPPAASHVTALSLRLVANDLVVDRSKLRYSEISTGTVDHSGHEDWSVGGVGTAGFFSAEARPDPVQAVAENTNELFVPGATNLQVFSPDGALVFAPASTREYGLVAPYSMVKVDQAFAFLDHRRRFVVTDGRTFEVISDDSIQDTLDTIADPSDCFGYRVKEGPIDCLVWTFPADGRTFAYQRKAGWSQWQGSAGGAWKPLAIQCHAHSPVTNDNLVGTLDGRVGVLRMGETSDLGEVIVARVETGFQNHGTDRRKHCLGVRMSFERGKAFQPSSEPVGFLEYADGPGEWSSKRAIHLGSDGDTAPVVRFRSLGVYRRRSWRFTFSAPVDLVLASAEEEFEVLEQ